MHLLKDSLQACNFATKRSCQECLGQVSDKSSKNRFVICYFFPFFLSLEENKPEYHSFFEDHIGILIECYQNDLKVVYRSNFNDLGKNWENTYWSIIFFLVSIPSLINKSYVSKFERCRKFCCKQMAICKQICSTKKLALFFKISIGTSVSCTVLLVSKTSVFIDFIKEEIWIMFDMTFNSVNTRVISIFYCSL